ncbi:MAG: Mpo1-like protein [Planctomycetota bacterium]
MTDTDTGGPEHYRDFTGFYAHYLGEHAEASTRAWHVAGTLGLLACLVAAAALDRWWLAGVGVGVVYGAAWFSHLVCERNRPATFRQPIYSIAADFRMCFELLTLRRPFREPRPDADAPASA